MSVQDLGSIGELIATIATLSYLAMQIRQNTISVRASCSSSTVHGSAHGGRRTRLATTLRSAPSLTRSCGSAPPDEALQQAGATARSNRSAVALRRKSARRASGWWAARLSAQSVRRRGVGVERRCTPDISRCSAMPCSRDSTARSERLLVESGLEPGRCSDRWRAVPRS
jgi:hypothetical protein